MRIEFPLLDLPNELVAHIIEFIDNIAILRKLACTCHRLQQLTEPVLWRSILIREAPRAQQVLDAYTNRLERASALHVLVVPCDGSSTVNLSALTRVLMQAPNLRDLMLESPSCNKQQFEVESAWRLMTDQIFLPFQRAVGGVGLSSRPLQKLTKLTLHLNGPLSPYWTPDERSLPIFLHPTLKYLRVSCVNFPSDAFNEVGERFVTPLQHLILEECNISHEGLCSLLALPKALQSLYLGENRHNESQFANEVAATYNHLFLTSARATVHALSQQKHSLRSLTYISTRSYLITPARFLESMRRPREPSIDAGFADFHSLESIAIVGSCSAFERAVMSSRSPPNLRSISYQSENPIPPYNYSSCSAEDKTELNNELLSRMPFLRAPSASVPATMENLIIIRQRSTFESSLLTNERKHHIRSMAEALRKVHGMTLTVTEKVFGRYFPPFLHGEPEPKDRLVYDGTTDEFDRTIYIDSDSDEE